MQHGVEKLRDALTAHGWQLAPRASTAAAVGGRTLSVRLDPKLSTAEALAIKAQSASIALTGADARGLMYALLDIAERVSSSTSDSDPFSEVHDATEQPFVRERSLSVYTMNRAYWESRFYDEAYWTRYFDLLAASRFNKFLIVFGYENGGFLAPCYPYFFDTPGFSDVHFLGLTVEQQQKNTAALNRLIALAHARGIAVGVGIWDHIYRGGVQGGGNEWEKTYTAAGQPVPNTVTGVTTENLNAYTLAALEKFLGTFPALDEVQFRIHEESGLKRSEMDAFWREVFNMTKRVQPTMLFEARAKGTPDSVIATALELGVHLRVETKFWMEQMGLPFHPTHVNAADQTNRRHGYADLLRYPKKYDLNWRLWNGGTARVLLWGDPEYVRRYSASTALYDDAPIWDVNEPLATKMEAQRPDLPVFALMPEKYRYTDYEFERYWHFYQLWGRLGYNPATPDAELDREFTRRFGVAIGPHVATALHHASQVLPMLVASSCYPYSAFPTTRGWAERQSLGVALNDYAKNTGTDTEQFESFDAAAQRILAGGTTTKRTPDATARWLDETADAILAETKAIETLWKPTAPRASLELESTLTDVKILAQLARFHARRSLAAVHYNLFKRSLKLAELLAATYGERDAVAEWRQLVSIAGDRYTSDLAMGARNHSLCGHWRDELVKLENDVKELESQCCPPDEAVVKEKVWQPAALSSVPQITAQRPTRAQPGQPLVVTAKVFSAEGIASVKLRYRHLTQYEDYATLEMTRADSGDYVATVPGEFLKPEWDFMYFIEATDRAGHGTQWPDLAKEQPYVIVPLERAK